MTTFLFCNGLDPVTLADEESFNKVRKRLTDAKKNVIDYENGNINGVDKGQKFEPFHLVSFQTDAGGRISIDPLKIIGVGSTEPKDVGTAGE